jgi:dihydroxyacetone synthase
MPERKAESNSMTDVQKHNTSGSTAYGKAAVNGLLKQESKPAAPKQANEDDVQLVLQNFRVLIADLCQQFGMGKHHHVS